MWLSTSARLSGTFPQCDCIRLYLSSRETLSPDILSVHPLTWFGAWCGSFGFRACGGQHSSLTWLLFVRKAEIPPLDKQRLEVSVSDAIRLAPPHCTFLCRFCILFRPSWPVCRELCHQPGCHVCMVASASQALLLQGIRSSVCSFVGLSWTSAPSRKQAATEQGGEGTHTATLSSPICRELSPPPTLYIYS